MARPQKTPLRVLTAAERAALVAVARAGSERADRVARARVLLAVADGTSFVAAARCVAETYGALAAPVQPESAGAT